MAHHPIPQIWILCIEQLVECLLLRFVGSGKVLVQPSTEQGVQLAGTATSAPAQATFIHNGWREAPR